VPQATGDCGRVGAGGDGLGDGEVPQRVEVVSTPALALGEACSANFVTRSGRTGSAPTGEWEKTKPSGRSSGRSPRARS
jgi:hypothetical protein